MRILYRASTVALCLLVLISRAMAAMTPERSKGISMHMLPKKVAVLNGQKWGLTVSYAEFLKSWRRSTRVAISRAVSSVREKARPRVSGQWRMDSNHPPRRILRAREASSHWHKSGLPQNQNPTIYSARLAATRWLAAVWQFTLTIHWRPISNGSSLYLD